MTEYLLFSGIASEFVIKDNISDIWLNRKPKYIP